MFNRTLSVAILYLFVSPIHSRLHCGKCPTTDNYTEECYKNVMPPWPICLMHSADYYAEKSIDSASRCCQEDLSECKCPAKGTEKFKQRIGAFCEASEICKSQMTS